MLSTAAQRRRRPAGGEEEPSEQPSVAVLLDVAEEYRRKADAGKLRKIAPKRFNPEGEAWLPIRIVIENRIGDSSSRGHQVEWIVV
jgi:hypothetical protein